MSTKNLESRVKRLEADGTDTTPMVVGLEPGQSVDEAVEAHCIKYPELRMYNGPHPLIILD